MIMAWLRLSSSPFAPAPDFQEELKVATQHVEAVSLCPDKTSVPTTTREPSSSNKGYKFVTLDVPDSDLPFISASEVKARARSSSDIDTSSELWIVVDNIVYDCSGFSSIHPGGQLVIESFRGEECSWQFWRSHRKRQMEEFGKLLRIGRTTRMVNRFAEPKRWAGIKAYSSADEWEYD
jgi:cytochrome b involved in lipid metabolism